MAWQILSIVAPLVIIVVLGLLYGRKHRPDISAANRMNMEIFCPALIFSVLANTQLELSDYSELLLASIWVVLGSGLILWPLIKVFKLKARTFLPPMMFNNAGNLGLPLIILAFGEAAMPIAVILFVVEMVLHFSVGLYFIDSQAKLLSTLKIPVIIAAIAGLIWGGLELSLPTIIATPIDLLGQISVPLMLFTLGVRLIDVDLKDWKIGLLGAVACPLSGLICAGIAIMILPLTPLQQSCLILFSALPPAVLNFIVAEQYQVEPQRVASIVMLGNIASLFFIPLTLFWVLPAA
ncbi:MULTISPECIES: AEC family transporter [unclassified Agarivorans]|uniref:AEC family transporter n=1 Tax=unclassified Agarivorans TaxID=2636026 RepID=UPI0026E16588|nr:MULTISPECIES: AEC family transporter [unclassified Agarivorans]MDO6685160.1 AEC family transporter [Agarivorans sp. 3_MG-2023]MDO6715668.1 AEC family transporter [Agarivorans sp. 2_MG-2023]